MEIELNNEEKKEIKSLEGSLFNEINKDKTKLSNRVNAYDLIKYVCLWKKILKNQINIPTFIPNMGDEQQQVIGFKQLEQVGQESFDRTTPLGLLKLQIYQFCTINSSLINEDQMNSILSNIDNYEIFIDKIEYKNPIYLSLGYICIKKEKQIDNIIFNQSPSPLSEQEEEIIDEFGDYDPDYDSDLTD